MVKTDTFRLSGTSDRFWNKDEFIKFLFDHKNQAITLEMDPEAVCLENLGVYKLLDDMGFTEVHIVTGNPLEKHSNFDISLLDNRWVSKKEKFSDELHCWNKSKIFYTLFGRPTASRLAVAAYLRSKYQTITHIHFSATTDHDNLIQFELDKLLSYRKESINEVGNLINDMPLLLSSPERYTAFEGYDYQDPLTYFYKDILIDIVVESHVAGKTFYPTEKTFRPMWLKKPFIIFASRDYLDYLHQMGFKTFCEFWDETYDGYETGDRLRRILSLIDNISQKSISELEDMYVRMQSILDHNYNLLVNQTYSTRITEIE